MKVELYIESGIVEVLKKPKGVELVIHDSDTLEWDEEEDQRVIDTHTYPKDAVIDIKKEEL